MIDPADPRAERAQRYLSQLDRMAEVGAEFVEGIRPVAGEPLADRNLRAHAFALICRTIRRNMLLADRFDDIAQQSRQRAEARRLTNPTPARRPPVAAEPLPRGENPKAEPQDRLERLETLDSIADLERHPMPEAVATLAREYDDFGIRVRTRTAPDHVPGTTPYDPAEDDPDLIEKLLRHRHYPRDD